MNSFEHILNFLEHLLILVDFTYSLLDFSFLFYEFKCCFSFNKMNDKAVSVEFGKLFFSFAGKFIV